MGFAEVVVRRARLLEVSVPLRVPFAISGGTMINRRSLVLELQDEDGVVGYGEAAPFDAPFYSPETVASVQSCIRNVLVPRVLGQSFHNPADYCDTLRENVRGNHMACAALDTAWWDLQSRRLDTPLANLVDERLRELGVRDPLRSRRSLECGAALGIPRSASPDDLREEVREACRLGFRRIKLKVRPGWGEEAVRVTRDELRRVGVDLPISVDGNGAYRLLEHRSDLSSLDDLGLLFIEQPFEAENLWDTVKWDRDSETPLCLDESLTGDDIARQVLEMTGPKIWNLKVQRLGGLEETCRVYARGLRAGAEMWIGTMPETGLGVQSALALGGLSGLKHVSDVAPSAWWYREGSDLVAVEMSVTGEVAVPQAVSDPPKLDGVREIALLS